MTVHVYECLLILDPNRYARDPHGVASSIPAMIEKTGGEVVVSRLWNEQKLAYPIEGHRKGTYWLTYFRMDSSRVGDFERECRLNENVLRHLTLKIDPRLEEVLIEYAKGGKPLAAARQDVEELVEEEGVEDELAEAEEED